MTRKVTVITSMVSAFGSYCYIKYDRTNQKQVFAKSKNLNLERVQVIFRHGARAPISCMSCVPDIEYGKTIMNHPLYTLCPYKLVDSKGKPFPPSKLRGNEHKFLGQLTGPGAEQLNVVGRMIRGKYIEDCHFIPQQFDHDLVHVYTTKMKRTVESARSLLAGMYPEQAKAIPINIHEVPDDEILAPSFKACEYLKNVSAASWDNTDNIEGMKPIRERLQQLLDVPDSQTFHIVLLRDILFSHNFHQVLPYKLADPELMRLAEQGAISVMNHVFCGKSGGGHSDKVVRLSIGRLVHVLTSNMEEFARGNLTLDQKRKKPKLILYSGHDTTLIPLLSSLGIYDGLWPPFASNLVIELYNDGDFDDNVDLDEHTDDCTRRIDSYYVRVIYNGEEQMLPGCEDVMCPLADFKEIVKKFRISQHEYEIECKVSCGGDSCGGD